MFKTEHPQPGSSFTISALEATTHDSQVQGRAGLMLPLAHLVAGGGFLYHLCGMRGPTAVVWRDLGMMCGCAHVPARPPGSGPCSAVRLPLRVEVAPMQ